MTWSSGELHHIVKADDVKIASLRDDRMTPGTQTWVWCVAVNGELYVRAYNGKQSRSYQAAIRQGAGLIVAAGMVWVVKFELAAGEINASIDDAYRAQHKGSPSLRSMINDGAREATTKVTLQRNTSNN
ncbi:DUF2255 family protein [Dyella acidisoli]|uniref:Uncharacterized protein n=1 Tax=Dyella acidisoli TaxID=1867834 RepID=A0ABQ5XJ35_9GAMM|nr:DUF2255 family protein [Dyella acidisoli]GLQ91642.1 hypothetical protein GCM10007901_05920 [Dyella acidisoli]